jgi:hypothetical protein
MSMKYFCDSCDKELNAKNMSTTVVFGKESIVVIDVNAAFKRDLCSACYDQWQRVVDPKEWPRHAK